MPESAPERGITAPTVLERVTVALANYIADDARPTAGAVAACHEAAQLLWGPRQKANPRIDGEPWEPWEGNGPCQDCGARNVVWFTDNATWTAVMGDQGGLFCPSCFIMRAHRAGLTTMWKVAPDV